MNDLKECSHGVSYDDKCIDCLLVGKTEYLGWDVEHLKKVIEWMRSKEGQEALKRSSEQAEKVIKHLREIRKIQVAELLRPFDI